MKKLAIIAILLLTLLPRQTTTSPINIVLWIQDAPFYYGLHYYQLVRSILTSCKMKITVFYPSIIRTIERENIGLEKWLKTSGYSLIIISYSIRDHKDAIKDLIKAAFEAEIPILYVPGDATDLGIPLGLGMAEKMFSKINTSVVYHKVTNGTYIVGVYNYSIIGTFYPAGDRGEYWTPIAMIGDGAIVAVAEFGEVRAAAIAPYLYSEDIYDNKRLIKNIVYWLLHKSVPRTELGEWPPVNETEYRMKILAELERLREERDKLNTTLIELQTRIGDLNATLLRLHQLEEEVQQLKDKLSNKSIEMQVIREEFEKMSGEVRYIYKLFGAAIAVSFIIGFVSSHVLTKKYLKRKSEQK